MNSSTACFAGMPVLAEKRQQQVQEEIQSYGFAFVPGHIFLKHLSSTTDLVSLSVQWDYLPVDEYSFPTRCQRYRRFGRFLFDPLNGRLSICPERPFIQEKKHNALYGSVERHFAPLSHDTLRNPLLNELIRFDFEQLPTSDEEKTVVWEIGVHQIAIRPTDSLPGNATPEGIHQDGHFFVAQHIFGRKNITGGVSRLFDLKRRLIEEVTLVDTLDSILIKDAMLFHEVSPIVNKEPEQQSFRNMLLVDFNCLTYQ